MEAASHKTWSYILTIVYLTSPWQPQLTSTTLELVASWMRKRIGQLLGTRAGRSSTSKNPHLQGHILGYTWLCSTATVFSGQTKTIRFRKVQLLDIQDLSFGLVSFRQSNSAVVRPNNNSFTETSPTKRTTTPWQALAASRCLIDFCKRSIGSRKLTVQPENTR